LRFFPQLLRRTVSTPHSAGFARLELGLFTKSSPWITFYEFINHDITHPYSAVPHPPVVALSQGLAASELAKPQARAPDFGGGRAVTMNV